MSESELEKLEVAPSWGRRLDGIEGLRGIAAVSVMIGHLIFLMRAEDAAAASPLLGALVGLLLHGVTLFFVLSGFLLYRPFVTAVLKGRPVPRTADFYVNRVLRIWPAYVVVLVVAAYVLRSTITEPHLRGAGGAAAEQIGAPDLGTFLANLVLVQGWFPSTNLTGLGVSWSLVPEVSFYVVLPALALFGRRLVRFVPATLAVVAPALLLLVVGEAGRWWSLAQIKGADAAEIAWLQSGGNGYAVFYRSIFAQGGLFALGMIVAVVVVVVEGRAAAGRRARAVAWALGVLAAVLIVVVHTESWITSFVGLGFAAVVALTRLPSPGRLVRGAIALLESTPFRLAGLASYSIYLWHFPVIWFLRKNVDGTMYTGAGDFLWSAVVVVVPTLALSALTYRYVEAPAMRRKRRTVDASPASGQV